MSFRSLRTKALAVAMAGAMATMLVPANAFAHYAPDNTTGRAVQTSESSDSWGDGKLVTKKNNDGSVSYTGIVHGDTRHYHAYGLTTKISTDSSGKITAIDLTSGNETFAGAWGYKNVGKLLAPIEGYLPDGVDFTATKDSNSENTYTIGLTGAAKYGNVKVAAPSSTRGSSQQYKSVTAYKATATNAAEVDGGATYDEASSKITINNPADVNLVKVTWKIGAENLYFNTYFAVGDEAAQDAADAYVDTIKATEYATHPDLTGTMGSTDRDQWTAIMGTIYQQRTLQSWGAYLANDSLTGEIDDLDTVSGATKTSDPFVASLNQAVKDGIVKGVSENVKFTIDGSDIDINKTPMDQSTVTVNSDGKYVLENVFPYGADAKDQHAVKLDEIKVYQTGKEKLTTQEVEAMAKDRSAYKNQATSYTPESLKLNPTETTGRDGKTTTKYSWGDFSNNLISFDYKEGEVARTITAKDKSVDAVALTYTIGHANITIAYDLKQMKAAGDVKAQIESLTNDANEVAAARSAYNALNSDVKGFVTNIDKLEAVEANVKPSDTPSNPSDTKQALDQAAISLSKTSYTYNGKAQMPSVSVVLGSKTLSNGTDYTVSYSGNTNAGTATVTVTGNGLYTGTKTATFKISKASQKLKVSGAKKTVKAKKLKKKKQVTSKVKVTGAKGKVTYKKSSGSSKLKISKSGKITVAKKAKKGTYKIKVKVKSAATSNYTSASATKTIKVVVK